MRSLFGAMARIAPVPVPVLILGETGTGKELVARALHRTSPRPSGPFVAVNCAAVPGTLFEAECFGYEAGAFTDARARHAGWFEQADKGTLFLDEVGDMPSEAQAKLLRVIERQEVVRLGGVRTVRVDVRLVAATNADLDRASERGTFRLDLFHRLAVTQLRLPPLHMRRNDIPTLVMRHLVTVEKMTSRHFSVSLEAMDALVSYQWPGNIRELENAILQSALDAAGPVIEAHNLPLAVQGPGASLGGEDFIRPLDRPLSEAVRQVAERLERRWIYEVLRASNGNRSEAAGLLGIDRRTLFQKMRRHRIEFQSGSR
jgi:DNA-binding NtrC family response regulator